MNTRQNYLRHHQSYEADNQLVDSMFSNRYHINGNYQRPAAKLQQPPPVFDYQWWSAPNPYQNNVLLEREKNFDRIQKWLTYQQEFSGCPPPEEESRSSLRSSSVVETYSPVDENTDYIPRYKSEELIRSHHQTDDSTFSGIELKRYYSPNLSRRRRYSPRSDPNLPQTIIYSTISNKVYPSPRTHETKENLTHSDCPTPLNYYYFQSEGKGNTFPRRSNIATTRIRVDSNHFDAQITRRFHSPSQMGQQLERHRPLSYDERVMPNPYATVEDMTPSESQKIPKLRPRPVSMLEGRSFVLNGVSSINKQEISGAVEKSSSMMGNMSLDTQRLLSGNLPDVALTAAKAIHKRELSDSLSKFHMPKENTHIRVSSAPETTQNSYDKKNEEEVLLRIGRAKRVPALIRKVKASSWPKRAVLPMLNNLKYSDSEPLNGKSLNKTESGYNTEKSEEKLEQVLQECCIDKKNIDTASYCASDTSESPPMRPPLPYNRDFTNKTSHKSKSSDDVSRFSIESPVQWNTFDKIQVSEETNLQRKPCYQSEQSFEEHIDHATFNLNNDLSKNVSMSLKDLIRIHEQEIARVSGSLSTASLKGSTRIREKSRNSSLSESRPNSAWKRHTTIGLLTNSSLDNYQDISCFKEKDELMLKSSPSYSPSHSSLPYFDHYETESLNDKRYNNSASVTSEHEHVSPTSIINCSTWPLLSHKTKPVIPVTAPKPKRNSFASSVIIEPSFINISSAREQFATLTSNNAMLDPKPIQQATCKSDVMIQTDKELSRSNSFRRNEQHVKTLTTEIENLKSKFNEERQDLLKKLEEQKKVANAYQKLEGRYRRKVYTLKKDMKNCSCLETRSKGFGNDVDRVLQRQSLSPSLLLEEHRDFSVQKVESILHQLEAWLNHQSNGIEADASEISSLMESTVDEVYPRYKLPDYFSSPPLEIIDKIDATSV